MGKMKYEKSEKTTISGILDYNEDGELAIAVDDKVFLLTDVIQPMIGTVVTFGSEDITDLAE